MNIHENANVVNCDFAYECPQNWEGMDATENDDVRFCGKCSQNVYFARNDEMLQQLIVERKCVAVLRQNKEAGEIYDRFQPPGFPRMTAGIPVMPERLKGENNFTWQQPEPLPKSNEKAVFIIIGIIGLIVGGAIGFLIVKSILG